MMPDETAQQRSNRVLQPIDRVSEVLFGLIMVLTFTGSLSVAEAGHEDVQRHEEERESCSAQFDPKHLTLLHFEQPIDRWPR